MQLTLTIPDMACGACAEKIAQAITAIDAQAKVNANPQTKLVQIESNADESTLKSVITQAGYTVS